MLIKDIDDFKSVYGGVQTTMYWDTWSPFVNEAELGIIIPAIGEEFYDELNELVITNATLNGKQARLLGLLKISLAAYADFVGWFRISASTGDAGKVMNTPENTQAPAKWFTAAGRRDAQNRGDKFLEQALVYLEKNADEFETWKDSDACTLYDGQFISSASELTKYFPQAKHSRRVFLQLKEYISSAQEYLAKVVGKAQCNAWMEKISDANATISPLEDDAFLLVRAMIARKAFADALPYLNISEDWRLISETDGVVNEDILPQDRRDELAGLESMNAEKYQNELIRLLQANASDNVFPEYFGSGLYESRIETKSFSKFQNKPENKFAVL
ncbi:DUF6712 family protein [Emticicia sp. W12TSBA100-4]|uniref:DUF6712 family protein n=1 Tax=Emticicia sp. W12TSBA100-4 TaxID=3160965 RepID=UPI003305DA51